MSNSTVKLKISDEEVFEVEVDVACRSNFLREMIKNNGTHYPILLHDISGWILRKVILYCRYHGAFEKVIGHALNSVMTLDGRLSDFPEGLRVCRLIYELTNEMQRWDEGFVAVDTDTLVDMRLAAGYLDIRDLVELTYQYIADKIKAATGDDIMLFLRRKNNPPPSRRSNHTPTE